MYPSGQWDGFWEQPGFGRQSMQAFVLNFNERSIRGEGQDIVGRFAIQGECDSTTGRIRFVKHYLGKHRVTYNGEPDGEGSICGYWRIDDHLTGPFLLRPFRRKYGLDDSPVLFD